jgi:hypothetical protein
MWHREHEAPGNAAAAAARGVQRWGARGASASRHETRIKLNSHAPPSTPHSPPAASSRALAARPVGLARPPAAPPASPPLPQALGPRLARYVPDFVPLLLATLGDARAADGERDNTHAMNDLRENILSALEALWTGDFDEALAPFVAPIVAAASEWAAFDPNYTYDDDGGGGGMDVDADGADADTQPDADWGDDADDAGADDDDSSWKTRKVAVRVLVSAAAYAAGGGAKALLPHWRR